MWLSVVVTARVRLKDHRISITNAKREENLQSAMTTVQSPGRNLSSRTKMSITMNALTVPHGFPALHVVEYVLVVKL